MFSLVLPTGDSAFWVHWARLACEELLCLPAIDTLVPKGMIAVAIYPAMIVLGRWVAWMRSRL